MFDSEGSVNVKNFLRWREFETLLEGRARRDEDEDEDEEEEYEEDEEEEEVEDGAL